MKQTSIEDTKNMKHTQGQWIAKITPGGVLGGNLVSVEPNICSLSVSQRNPKEAEANAKLIAAAPELLESATKAAKWIMSNCEGDYEETPWRDLVNAIKAATE